MSHFKTVLALASLSLLTAACGKASQPIDAVSATKAAQLRADQDRARQAIVDLGVMSVDPGTSSGNLPSPPDSCVALQNQDPAQAFQALQLVLQDIEKDVQNQDLTKLDSDLQKFQDDLLKSLSDWLAKIDVCVQQAQSQSGVVPPPLPQQGAVPPLPPIPPIDPSLLNQFIK